MKTGKAIISVDVKVPDSDSSDLTTRALEAVKKIFFDGLDRHLERENLTIEPPISDGYRETRESFRLTFHVFDDKEFYSSLRQSDDEEIYIPCPS